MTIFCLYADTWCSHCSTYELQKNQLQWTPLVWEIYNAADSWVVDLTILNIYICDSSFSYVFAKAMNVDYHEYILLVTKIQRGRYG